MSPESTASCGHGRMAVRDRFADIRRFVPGPAPVIVDGGAHVGATVHAFLTMYPEAIVHAFEPAPPQVQHLKRAFPQGNVTIHALALGAANGRVSLHLLHSSPANSILNPGAWLFKYHGAKMEVTEQIEVDMVRLDSHLPGTGIDILKLDLQGYELEALKGAERLLPGIKVITLEVEFVPLYVGQPLFSDIEPYLRRQGFCLFNLYELWTQADGQLTAGDAIFLNDRFFPAGGR